MAVSRAARGALRTSCARGDARAKWSMSHDLSIIAEFIADLVSDRT